MFIYTFLWLPESLPDLSFIRWLIHAKNALYTRYFVYKSDYSICYKENSSKVLRYSALTSSWAWLVKFNSARAVSPWWRQIGWEKKQWDVIIILVLYFPDESEFETALLEILKGELEQADLALDTRLIITYLCNKFDGFDGVMEKVNFVVFWLRKNSYLNL